MKLTARIYVFVDGPKVGEFLENTFGDVWQYPLPEDFTFTEDPTEIPELTDLNYITYQRAGTQTGWNRHDKDFVIEFMSCQITEDARRYAAWAFSKGHNAAQDWSIHREKVYLGESVTRDSHP